MHQKETDDNNHNNTLFKQCSFQSFYGFFDESRTVIGCDHIDTFDLEFFHFCLDPFNGSIDIFTVTYHHDTANHFTFTVQVSHTPACGRYHFYTTDLSQCEWYTILGGDDQLAYFVQIFDVTFGLYHPLKTVLYDDTSTRIIIVLFDYS